MGRLVTWLAMSGVCMLGSIYAFGMVVFIVVMPQWVNIRASILAVHACIFAFCRNGISYAQLQAVKPSWRRSTSTSELENSMEREQQCSVACLAVMRTCVRAPLDQYWKYADWFHYGKSHVLPFFISDTTSVSRNSDSPCNDDTGLTSSHHTFSQKRCIPTFSPDHETPDGTLESSPSLEASESQDFSNTSRSSLCTSSRNSNSNSTSNNSSSSSRSRSSSSSGFKSSSSISNDRGKYCKGESDQLSHIRKAHASHPKLLKAPMTGQSYRHLLSRDVQPLEPVCEDSSVGRWQALHTSRQQPPADPLVQAHIAVFDDVQPRAKT